MTDEILIRFLKGNANCDEIHLINKWLQDNPQNIDYLKQLHDSLLLIDVWAGKSSQEDQKYINQILKRTIKNKSKRYTLISYLGALSAVAAIIILVILFSVNYNQNTESILLTSQEKYRNEYRNSGTLLLSDGQKIPLDQFENEIILSKDTLWVNHHTYINSESNIRNNLICTQQGSLTKMRLNDGTEIHLNSGSVFEFPQLFTKSERNVFLDGEAYLSVSKQNGNQFVVNTSTKKVQVLGTCFNVRAYSTKKTFSTVLVEGSVAISSDKERTLIKPEQMYVYYKDRKEGEIMNIDPTQYISWKDKEIRFQQQPIKEIIGHIAEFYGYEIDIDNPVLNNYELTGTLSLKSQIHNTLNILFLTLPHSEKLMIKEVENRKLIVK
ncbi:FecR family protein [Bacteroides nordii]|jgi:putative anti-sigma factor|uniref:FecR family protein n=1 Tax=Bacteroides nordii TaxID=291645 RepID=UPI0018990449|nr:FecR family protein [Bacteroides nordii]